MARRWRASAVCHDGAVCWQHGSCTGAIALHAVQQRALQAHRALTSRKAARTVGERRLRRGRSGSSSVGTTGVLSGTRGLGRLDSGSSAIAVTRAARRLVRHAGAPTRRQPGAATLRSPLYAPTQSGDMAS